MCIGNFFSALGRAICCCFMPAPVDNRGVYERVTANPPVNPTPNQILAWPQTPGGLAVAAYNLGVLNNPNVLTATQSLHDTLANNHLWTWQGQGGGGNPQGGCQLLQGARNSGECRCLAEAFKILLTADNPYGYQHPAGQFAIRTYSGAYAEGFIAAHNGVFFGLTPNIYNPVTGNPENFYLWSDHKVVEYNHVFYDPSYRASYPNLAAMAQAELLQSVPGFNAGTFINAFVLDVIMTDNAAPLNLRGFYIQCFYNGVQLAPNLAAIQNNVGGYVTVFVGPFNPGVGGNAGNNFNFDPNQDYLNGVNLN